MPRARSLSAQTMRAPQRCEKLCVAGMTFSFTHTPRTGVSGVRLDAPLSDAPHHADLNACISFQNELGCKKVAESCQAG
eukprot:7128537-Prymnesium_polylepis.1